MYRPIHLILLRNLILQRYHNDVTIKTFRFDNAHLTAPNKGKIANQNAAYKIIALESSLLPQDRVPNKQPHRQLGESEFL